MLNKASQEESYLTDFNKRFPIFSFIGTKKCISAVSIAYDASSADAMLVCKYFKAKELHQLDRLHNGWFIL